jgi:hypothetical protein
MNKQFIQKIRFYIHRGWMGYIAPFLALAQDDPETAIQFHSSDECALPVSYWKYFEPQNITRGIAKLMKAYAEEQQAEIEARKKSSGQMCTQNWHPKKPRPPFIKKPLTVMYGDQEYRVQWYANFKTRYLLIFVPSIQPQAILEVISRLSDRGCAF